MQIKDLHGIEASDGTPLRCVGRQREAPVWKVTLPLI